MPGRSPGPCLGVVLAVDGHRLVVAGTRRARCELRLAEQALVCHVPHGGAALCFLGTGMAEQNADRRCVVDDDYPFETVKHRLVGWPSAQRRDREGARGALPFGGTRNPWSRRNLPRLPSVYTLAPRKTGIYACPARRRPSVSRSRAGPGRHVADAATLVVSHHGRRAVACGDLVVFGPEMSARGTGEQRRAAMSRPGGAPICVGHDLAAPARPVWLGSSGVGRTGRLAKASHPHTTRSP